MSTNIYNSDLTYKNISSSDIPIPISSTIETHSNTFSVIYVILLIFIVLIIIFSILILVIYLTKDDNITLKDSILQYLYKFYNNTTNIFSNSLPISTKTENKEKESSIDDINNDNKYNDYNVTEKEKKDTINKNNNTNYYNLNYNNNINENENNNENDNDNENDNMNNIYKLLDKAVEKEKYIPSAYETHKQGYCFVGKNMNTGVRTCAEIGIGDKCMSGDIFPSREICINPSLRP